MAKNDVFYKNKKGVGFMKIKKWSLVVSVVFALITLILSLCLCLIADLNTIELMHTFRWCVWLTIICGVSAFIFLMVAFNTY